MLNLRLFEKQMNVHSLILYPFKILKFFRVLKEIKFIQQIDMDQRLIGQWLEVWEMVDLIG